MRTTFLILVIANLMTMVISCSSDYGCYTKSDMIKAHRNGLPYWEDAIHWFPPNVMELTKDRDIIPPKTLSVMPPPRTFYDEHGDVIEVPDSMAPEKFAGYKVEVSYYLTSSPDVKANRFTIDFIHSEALVENYSAEMKAEEDTEIRRINGFRIYRSDPEVRYKEIAFYNDQIAIECQIQPANFKRDHELFLKFIETINQGRFMKFLQKHEMDYGISASGKEDSVDSPA